MTRNGLDLCRYQARRPVSDDRGRQRRFARCFKRCRNVEQIMLVHVTRRNYIDHLRLVAREGPSLVEEEYLDKIVSAQVRTPGVQTCAQRNRSGTFD